MEIYYTLQFNEKRKTFKIVKNTIHETQNYIDTVDGWCIISTWFKKRNQAEAYRTFLLDYIFIQNDTVVNWKCTSEKLSNICESLEYLIESYNNGK